MRQGLLIVDMQQAFFPPQRLVAGIQAEIPKAEVVVATQWLNTPTSPWVTRMGYEGAMRETEAANLALHLPARATVLPRTRYGLAEAELAQLRQPDVVWEMCGVETDACVMAVAFSLWDAEIPFRVLSQLCWTSAGDAWHYQALAMMRRQFGVAVVA